MNGLYVVTFNVTNFKKRGKSRQKHPKANRKLRNKCNNKCQLNDIEKKMEIDQQNFKHFNSEVEIEEYVKDIKIKPKNKYDWLVLISPTCDFRKSKKTVYKWEQEDIMNDKIFYLECHSFDTIQITDFNDEVYKLKVKNIPASDVWNSDLVLINIKTNQMKHSQQIRMKSYRLAGKKQNVIEKISEGKNELNLCED